VLVSRTKRHSVRCALAIVSLSLAGGCQNTSYQHEFFLRNSAVQSISPHLKLSCYCVPAKPMVGDGIQLIVELQNVENQAIGDSTKLTQIPEFILTLTPPGGLPFFAESTSASPFEWKGGSVYQTSIAAGESVPFSYEITDMFQMKQRGRYVINVRPRPGSFAAEISPGNYTMAVEVAPR
jgi:hypothetical protein